MSVSNRARWVAWAGVVVLSAAGPVRAQSTAPLIEQARLSKPVENSNGFGRVMAVDGDTLVVAAPDLFTNGIQRGVVSIYTNVSGTWTLQQSLTRTAGSGFGGDVDVSGDTLIVASSGSSQVDVTPSPLVFVRTNGVWNQQTELLVNGTRTRQAGEKVAIDGDTALVRTLFDGVYVFARTSGVWTQSATLMAAKSSGQFGGGMALDGDTAIVGLQYETVGANANQGTARVFVRNGDTWTQQATLAPSAPRTNEFFGSSLALDGDTALVEGREAYEYRRIGGTWVAQAPLELPAAGSGSPPYQAVQVASLDGDVAIVASGWGEGDSPVYFVYQRIGGRWVRRQPGYTPARYLVAGDTVFGGGGGVVVVFALTAVGELPPGPPTLTASVSGGTLTLSWTPGSDGAATSYVLKAVNTLIESGNPTVFNANVGNVLQLTAQPPQGIYEVEVYAVNAAGRSNPSNTVEFGIGYILPPGPPTNLTASVTGTTVTFAWRPPSAGNVRDYELWASLTPTGPTIARVSLGSSLTATVPNVPPGTYYASVVARGDFSSSAGSNQVSFSVAPPTLPGAPTLNPATVTGSTVSLSWSPGTGGPPTGYTLTASTSPGGAAIATLPMNGTSVSFTSVPSGTYHVRLSASNAAGMSSPSAEVTIVVP